MKRSLALIGLACSGLSLSGCAAFVSTTNTTADALHTVAHGLSVSSRGTTNVSSGGSSKDSNAEAAAYLHSQMPEVRREAAAGGGEHIDALARLVDDTGKRPLGPWMQAHYATLFQNNPAPDTVLQAIESRAG